MVKVRRNQNMENPHTFNEDEPCASARIRMAD